PLINIINNGSSTTKKAIRLAMNVPLASEYLPEKYNNKAIPSIIMSGIPPLKRALVTSIFVTSSQKILFRIIAQLQYSVVRQSHPSVCLRLEDKIILNLFKAKFKLFSPKRNRCNGHP